ncbi:hypothetical protein GP486_005387 [Trichoglossum hirsutum]|uniref:Uncharacterized protein n=1 Tax=Trichoglossum hirsutum TaxID=265104 RepID=A0A9P8L9C2_9PEZI|nr:hypothetical protein GP486_005387 [Trichoglossum hirsutum]
MKYLGLAILHAALVASAPQGTATSSGGSGTSPTNPPIFANTRREVHNCDTDWMKAIEAQAWADAKALAVEGNDWVPGSLYQPIMDMYMGKDSVNDPYKSTIKKGLQGEVDAHSPNTIFPESVISVYCGDAKPINGVRRNICVKTRNGKTVKPFAAAWVDRGVFWNNYYIVLCPRFFAEKDSLYHTLAKMNTGAIAKTNASSYKYTWGHVSNLLAWGGIHVFAELIAM